MKHALIMESVTCECTIQMLSWRCPIWQRNQQQEHFQWFSTVGHEGHGGLLITSFISTEISKHANKQTDPQFWQESDLRGSSSQIQDSHCLLGLCFQVTWKRFLR